VKRINVNPGARLSLQSHKHRAENWVVVEGEALVTINDDQLVVKKGESAYIPKGARHRMENRGQEEMVLIEVQYGDYLGEDDIERFEDDYGRTEKNPLTPAKGTTLETTSPVTIEANNTISPSKGEVHNTPSPLREEVYNSPSPLRGEGRGGGENSSNLQMTKEGWNGDGGEISPEALTHYKRWIAQPHLDPQTKEELLSMQDDPALIENHFGQELIFGTGGMRGIIGPGLNRINPYIIRRATQGLADYINSLPAAQDGRPSTKKQVAIAYDTRRYSAEFAEAAALVLAANGIKALLFNSIRPTPLLSYSTRALGCAAGIVITASHNPSQYNGYKVYGPDGGQAVSPLVDDLIAAIKPIDIFTGVKTIAKDEAIKLGLFALIDPAYDQNYLDAVKSLSLSNPEQCLKVVFTPLHGTGSVFVPDLLQQTRCVELHLVEEQMKPDHNFSTVRVPNPEDPAALSMALDLANQVGADLVLATDPDCDRVGTAIRDQDGELKILSGNQIGAVLIEYICSRHRKNGTMPADPVLVKTIVTGDLGRRVAESHGLKVVETLTGFKFIGDQMKHFEEKGAPHFVFGYEESCGYLTGTFVRDKDAVIASFLIAEMTAYYKEQGLNLLQVLEKIQQRVGYYRDELLTIELNEISEADRHVAAFQDLPNVFAGQELVEKRDYESSKGLKLESGEQFNLTLPRSPVLHYTLADGSWFAVRPSGTEPKVKFYLSVCAATAAAADHKLSRLREAVLEKR
jgi:phosphoglucomutase